MQSRNYKIVFVGFIVFLLSLFVVDRGVGLGGSVILDNLPNYSGQTANTNFLVKRMTANVVIFGPSTACHHYIPSMIKAHLDSLLNVNWTVYNTGQDGRYLKYNCCWIECVLERYNPDIIILDSKDSFLEMSDEGNMNLSAMFPYYDTNKVVRRYLNQLDFKEKIKLQSNLYRYNSLPLNLLSSFVLPKDSTDGYIPLYKEMDATKLVKTEVKKVIVNDNILMNFKNTIIKCKEKGVRLIVVSSPEYESQDNPLLKKICMDYQVPFVDMHNTEYFNAHPLLFCDKTHLNDDGAKIFTKRFFVKLDSILVNN